jgi:predicted kinase
MLELHHQTVVIVAGPPGAGKSTVAPRIARALGAAWIDIDATFSPIVPLLGPHPREVVRAAIYESLIAAAEAALEAGVHVVVAAPFTRERRDPDAWERLEARLSARGAVAELVWLHAPSELLLERLATRGATRDADKLADPASWLREAEPEAPPLGPHIAVDATDTEEHAVAQILRELGERVRAAAEHLERRATACSFSG